MKTASWTFRKGSAFSRLRPATGIPAASALTAGSPAGEGTIMRSSTHRTASSQRSTPGGTTSARLAGLMPSVGDGTRTNGRHRLRGNWCRCRHSCGLSSTGDLICWGKNNNGQADPRRGPFRTLAVGIAHTCVLDNDNMVLCQGENASGQSSPRQAAFTQISSGSDHTCGLLPTRGRRVLGRLAKQGNKRPTWLAPRSLLVDQRRMAPDVRSDR